MAISTYKVFLMKSTDGSKYDKLIDIKDFPDLGGAPELLELLPPVAQGFAGLIVHTARVQHLHRAYLSDQRGDHKAVL